MTATASAAAEPWNVETALVGALLEGAPGLIALAAEQVTPADFEDERCSLLYEAVLALDAMGRRVDLITVCEALKAQGKLAAAGGPAFVAGVTGNSAFPNVVEHARIIHDKGTRRALGRVAREVAQLAKDDAVELPSLLEESGRKFFEVVSSRQKSPFRPMVELLEETLSMLDVMKRDGGLVGLGTGFPDVDKLLAGMQPGELIILAARPGVGKTAFAMNLATHVALEKKLPVGVFSLEMPAKQLTMRLLSAESGVALERIRHGRLSPSEEERLTDCAQRLFQAPLHIDDSGDVSPLDLRAKARRLKQQHPTLSMLVLDYLQLVRVRGKVESRQVEVAEVSRALKQLAKELEVPVLALSQLNRRVEERGAKPRLSDLRESGAIEQDADVVMFLHRESQGDDEVSSGDAVPVELIVAKQRNGPIGEVPLVFLSPSTRFQSRAR